jgi:hypothetical protein
MAALMTREQVAEAHKAAMGRKEARRQVYTTYTDAEELRARLDGVTLPRVGLYAPDYRDPSTGAEWWDDRVAERNSSTWGFPETPLLTALAVLLHDGDDDGAREALKAARGMEPAVAWCVYRNLGHWQKHPDASRFGADRAVGRVLAEWERLRLPAEDPAAAPEAKPRRRRPWEKLTGAEATA